jgi:hypothetical protein
MRNSGIPFGLGAVEAFRYRASKLAQIDTLVPNINSRYTGKHEQAFDELRHVLRRFAHALKVTLSLCVELLGIGLEQYLAEAIDATKWCTQIVRYRIAKRLELTIGGLGGLFRAGHGIFCAFAVRSVPGDLRGADYIASGIVNRRDGNGNVNVVPVLPPP